MAQVAYNISYPDIFDMYDVAEAFGNPENTWIRFTIYIHNVSTLSQFQPYRDKLTSEGFEFDYTSMSWVFTRNIDVNGTTYELEIRISDAGFGVTISYDFRAYALY